MYSLTLSLHVQESYGTWYVHVYMCLLLLSSSSNVNLVYMLKLRYMCIHVYTALVWYYLGFSLIDFLSRCLLTAVDFDVIAAPLSLFLQ